MGNQGPDLGSALLGAGPTEQGSVRMEMARSCSEHLNLDFFLIISDTLQQNKQTVNPSASQVALLATGQL